MKGTAWKFGNDIDTDIILPGRYLIYTDEEKKRQTRFGRNDGRDCGRKVARKTFLGDCR